MPPTTPCRAPCEATARTPRAGSSRTRPSSTPPCQAGGAIISTLSDLRPYARAVCGGGLLERKTQKARLRSDPMAGEPDFVRYGQGLAFLGDWCGHNGTIFGFSSEMFYLPEEEAVIVVNVNRLDLDDESKSREIFLRVSKILFPEHVDW